MKILSPIDRPEEVEPLVEAGAAELYGGVQPRGWASRALSANQRTFASAQFPSEEALADAVTRARRLDATFHLVLNAPLYDPPAYADLVGLAERAAGWGAAGVIVGDVGLLLRLREAALPLEITLSTLAGTLNSASFRFFRALGARRAVLPRHLTLSEVGGIVRANPDLAFESFVLIGKCPNEEAWCTFQHLSPSGRWPCEVRYELRRASGGVLPGNHPLARWHASWRQADRRFGCALCALGELERLGVRHAKLVGRGGPTVGKVANVRLVASFLGAPHSCAAARRAYEERFGRPCHPLVCYFPELRVEPG